MVKIILWTVFSLCTAFVSWGDVKNRLLLCLAKEEEFIHKNKITHPLYHLNRFFMNHFSSRQGLKLKDVYYKQVCKTSSSSWNLMSLLLTKGSGLFYFENKAQELSGKDDLWNSALKLFFDHISRLEAQAPRANCLRDNIVHLKEITMRYSHLESLGHRQITQKDFAKIKAVLKALEDVGLIYQKCSPKQ